MKKGIIAVSLLLSGALLITPISSAITPKEVKEPVKVEESTVSEQTVVQETNNDQTTQVNTTVKEENVVNELDKEVVVKEEITTEEVNNQDIVEENKEDVQSQQEVSEEVAISMADAQSILNKYLSSVENVDFTYTYQGDENDFEVMQEKGIKGYVFLPNIETDMAYLVDKNSGSIYYFHPSGYLAQLQ